MTSSLVGSEMCIRDRSPLSLHRVRLPRLRQWERDRLVPELRLPSPRSDCLLYTSDAADDM
eukprot:10666350-Prorocentrum_lima.AAC.1